MTKVKITIGLILFAIFVLSSLTLFVIDLVRAIYWLSLFCMTVAAIGCIFFFISYLINRDYSFNDNDGLISLICLGVTLLLYIFAGLSYEIGYSESAIKTKMAATQYIDWYNEVTGLNQKITVQLIDTLCQSPSHNCDQARAGYIAYEQAYGLKDDADNFASLLRIAKIR